MTILSFALKIILIITWFSSCSFTISWEIQQIIHFKYFLEDLINHDPTYEITITLYWSHSLNSSLHLILSRSWCFMAQLINPIMTVFEFHHGTASWLFLVININSYRLYLVHFIELNLDASKFSSLAHARSQDIHLLNSMIMMHIFILMASIQYPSWIIYGTFFYIHINEIISPSGLSLIMKTTHGCYVYFQDA